MTDADQLARQILDIAEMVEDTRALEHRQGLARRSTRKYASDALYTLRCWREQVNAERGATMCGKPQPLAPHDTGSPAGERDNSSSEGSPRVS
jgi:hypothetical protein